MDKYNIFVVINYNDSNKGKYRVKTKVNNKRIISRKYLVGGGIYNKKAGGIMFFTSKDLAEIQKVTYKKTFMKNINFNYNVAAIPDSIQ